MRPCHDQAIVTSRCNRRTSKTLLTVVRCRVPSLSLPSIGLPTSGVAGTGTGTPTKPPVGTGTAPIGTGTSPPIGTGTGYVAKRQFDLPSLGLPSLGLPSLGLPSGVALPTGLPFKERQLELPSGIAFPTVLPTALPTDLTGALPSLTLPGAAVPAGTPALKLERNFYA